MCVNSFQLIAHRGASAEAPENTMSAIRQAVALNADWIEIDIHLSKDNVPVVIHDPFIPSTITGSQKIPVDNLTLQELKNLDFGSWFHKRFAYEKIPSLYEVLSEPLNNSSLMIEIKHEKRTATQIVNAVLEVLNSFSTLPTLKIGSFSLEIVQEIQQQAPNIPVIGIVEHLPMLDVFLNNGISHLAVWYKLLNEETIHKLLKNNTLIWTFTVDSLEQAEYLIAQGIQGVITNKPRELCVLFKNKKSLLENS